MGKIRNFTAKELMEIDEIYEPIVDKILYKGDLLLIKGKSKVGKSVFAQQLAFALSCGQNFLNVFEVKEAMNVCYIAGEGYAGNWQERLINMKKVCNINEDKFDFIECVSMELHKKFDCNKLYLNIKNRKKQFKLFVFDPMMYLCTGCNTSNPEHVGQFFGLVDTVRREYDATAIVVHHDSEKIFTTKGGEKHAAASPDTSMGHSSIGGFITHSYTIERYYRDKEKKWFQKVKAGNCRASWMVKSLDLYMIIPEEDDDGRLAYTLDVNEKSGNYSTILDYIRTHKLVPDHKLYENENIDMPSATFYYNLEKLYESKLVRKVKKGKKGFYEWIGE